MFADALKIEKQRSYTLKTAMDELQRTTDKLHRFGEPAAGEVARMLRLC